MEQRQHLSSTYIDLRRSKGRLEIREHYVSDSIDGIDGQWTGLRQIIKVRRIIKKEKAGRITRQTGYYISSLAANALYYSAAIRSHWSIENSLHWVKDVVFKEDGSKIKRDHGPQNISLLRSIAINLLRENGYPSAKRAVRLLSNNIPQLLKLIT